MALLTRQQHDEACLAILKALGVTRLDRVVGFVLACRVDDVPLLAVEYEPGEELADKTVLAAAAALAPVVQIEERAAEG